MSTLIIQRGHVARTSGATGAPGEQAMARRNAAEIVAIAKDLPDVTPVIIDADEPNHRYRGDHFVSLHGDGSANSNAKAASVGYRNPEGQALGRRWKQRYEEAGWPYGFMRDNYTTNLGRYYGTGQAVSAGNERAIITEAGFMTNPESRAFIESDAGVKAIAASVLVACYEQFDLARLLDNAPEPEKIDESDAPPSTEGSDWVITVGDRNDDLVRAWQRDLIQAGFNIPAGATGNFLSQTRDATNAFYRAVGLTASDPGRPVVGKRSREEMAKFLNDNSANWRGLQVRARQNVGSRGVNFYRSPGWAPSNRPDGQLPGGWRFGGGIHERRKVGNGYQYRVSNSNGDMRWITTNPKYIELVSPR